MSEPDFLSVEEVEMIHEMQLAAFGGLDGVRNRGGFESAVHTPSSSFGGQLLHADVFAQAAAYAYHIAQNQSFVDGNKRTGLVSALVFLAINGVEIKDPSERLYDAMIALAEKRMDKAGLADLLRSLAVKQP